MHHSLPEERERSFSLKFTLFQPHLSLSKPLTTKHSLLSPPLTTSLSTALSQHTIIQTTSEPVDVPRPGKKKEKKIDFLQLSGGGEEVLCASHGWLCCQLERTAAGIRSHSPTNKPNKPKAECKEET